MTLHLAAGRWKRLPRQKAARGQFPLTRSIRIDDEERARIVPVGSSHKDDVLPIGRPGQMTVSLWDRLGGKVSCLCLVPSALIRSIPRKTCSLSLVVSRKASCVPSGDQCGCSPDGTRFCTYPSAFTILIPPDSMNASCVPSGNHCGKAPSASFVSAVPSVFTTPISPSPCGLEQKAMRGPSGDQVGFCSVPRTRGCVHRCRSRSPRSSGPGARGA